MLTPTQIERNADDILALLREFNAEAENLIAHLEAISLDCRAELIRTHA